MTGPVREVLENILTAALSASHRQAVLEHLVQKCRIVAQGARKRGHEARGPTYEEKTQIYQQQLTNLISPTTGAA